MKVFYRHLLLLCFPFPIVFLTMNVFPFVASVFYAFRASAFSKQWVAFQHFAALFKNSYFLLALKNSLFLIVIYVPILLMLALFLAFALSKNLWANRTWIKYLIVLPMLLPTVSVATAARGIVDMLSTLALFSISPFGILCAIYLYQTVGLAFVLLYAGIHTIPPEVTEASAIDGARSWQTALYVQIPLLSQQLLLAVLLAVMYTFQTFKPAYLLFGSYPVNSVYTLQHFLNNHFYKLNYPTIASATLIFLIVMFLLTFSVFKIDQKVVVNSWLES